MKRLSALLALVAVLLLGMAVMASATTLDFLLFPPLIPRSLLQRTPANQ